ncbi:hypothetical protein [Acinetobacter larvae]|uniref:LD-carboxypeptidase N-terminal domain-containing protein n=1 Tax=Acinetobacter larvae TaxID=1789224 RepID=A0A1B2LWD1_9GAMM|nr:hypothetical protein [Acinetobacter larvae]AOA57251.1 hypothetical protein BFG52_02025 [Acinetobacter larvae]
MKIRYPEPLLEGDLIAITAPSAGVEQALYPRLDRAIDFLKQKGFRIVEGECLRQNIKQCSASTDRIL